MQSGWTPAKKKQNRLHHAGTQSVIASMVGLKNGHMCGNLTKKGGKPCRSIREHRIVVMIMIIMTLKDAVWDCLQSPYCAANCLQCVRSSGKDTVVCSSPATNTYHVVRKDSSAIRFERIESSCILVLIHWLKPLTDRGGERNQSTQRQPLMMSFKKMPHTY